ALDLVLPGLDLVEVGEHFLLKDLAVPVPVHQRKGAAEEGTLLGFLPIQIAVVVLVGGLELSRVHLPGDVDAANEGRFAGAAPEFEARDPEFEMDATFLRLGPNRQGGWLSVRVRQLDSRALAQAHADFEVRTALGEAGQLVAIQDAIAVAIEGVEIGLL